MAETAAKPPAAPGRAPGRFRRVVGAVGASLGLTVVFVASLVGSVLLHLDTAPVRRVVRGFVNPTLAGLFVGKLEVGGIERLNLHGLTLREVAAYDPRGGRVIHVDELAVDADVVGIVKSAAFGKGDVQVKVERVHLGDVDVAIERGPDGTLSLAEIFQPRHPSEPSPPPSGGREVHVAVARIEIGRAGAHGALSPTVPVDGEIRDFLADFDWGSDGLLANVKHLGVAARAPVPKPVEGEVTARLKMGSTLEVGATFDGTAGGVEVHTTAGMEGNHVAAKVRLPRVTAEDVAGFLPSPPPKIPLKVPVALEVDAEGELPNVGFKTKVTLEGAGSVAAEGTFDTETQVLDTKVAVSDVDAAKAVEDLPPGTPINADAHARVSLRDMKIDAEATTQAFDFGRNPVPAVKAKASLADGTWSGSADVDEKGATVHATFEREAKGDVKFTASAKVASVRAVPRLRGKVPPELAGAASVNVKGSLRGKEVEADVSGSFEGVEAPAEVKVKRGRITGHVAGPLDKLEVHARVTAQDVEKGKNTWNDARVNVDGPVMTPRFFAELQRGEEEKITLKGALDVKAATVSDLQLDVLRNGQKLTGKVARVAATPQGVKVEGITFSGDAMGGLKGGLVVVGKEVVGKLRGENVDFAKLVALARPAMREAGGHKAPEAQVSGLANVDIELDSPRPGRRNGHVDIEMVGGDVGDPRIAGMSGVFTAKFEGDKMRTDALFRLISHANEKDAPEDRCDGAIAQLRITGGDAEIPGPLLDAATWRKVAGQVEVAADDWNLRCIAKRVPEVSAVLSEVRGKVTIRTTVSRLPGARLPTVESFLVQTHGLELAGPRGLLADKPAWESLSTDVKLTAKYDPVGGVAGARIQILDPKASDNHVVADAALGTTLDIPALLDQSPERQKELLLHAPITGRVDVPRRSVAAFRSLPSFVGDRIPVLLGDVQLHGTVRGTVDKPQVEVHANTWDLTQARAGSTKVVIPDAWGLPVDLDAKLTYDGEKASLDARVKAEKPSLDAGVKPEKGDILSAHADVALPLAEALKGHVQPKGGVQVDLTGVPLGKIPFFNERSLDGALSGQVAITGLGEKPAVKVALASHDLKVGHDLVYDTAISLDAADTARVKVDLDSKTGGSFHAEVTNALTWTGGLVPAPDPAKPADIGVKAKAFRIAIATPFIPTAVVSRLDGTLNGDASVHFDRLDDSDHAKLRVGMTLKDAVLNLPALGQELHDTGIVITGGEGGEIVLHDLRVRGAKGLLTGEGRAHFEGLGLHKAGFHFGIAKGQELPITLEGAPLGDASGTIDIDYDKTPKEVGIKVGANLDVTLPVSVGRSVQSLDPSPEIHAQYDVPPEALEAPVGSARTRITLDPLKINIKGKLPGGGMLDLAVSGSHKSPLQVLSENGKTKVTGEIYLPQGGKIAVLKRDFEVEQGAITMREQEPGNPFVNVKLRWDSPEGIINLEYIGTIMPLNDDKLKFSSPTLPPDRAKMVVLTGGSDTLAGGGAGGATAGGVPGQGIAASMVASQLNTNIGGGLSTNIGTGDDGSLRPGIKFQKGKLDFEVSTYGATGSSTGSSTGSGPAPKGQHSLVTMDWRFWKNWLIKSYVDVGSDTQSLGADVLWQYRY